MSLVVQMLMGECIMNLIITWTRKSYGSASLDLKTDANMLDLKGHMTFICHKE